MFSQIDRVDDGVVQFEQTNAETFFQLVLETEAWGANDLSFFG